MAGDSAHAAPSSSGQDASLVAEHPSITSAEIVDAVDDGWIGASAHETTYAVTTGDVPA